MKRLILVCLLFGSPSPASAQSFGNYQAQVQRAIDELNLHWEQCRVNGVEVNDGPLLEQFCSHLVALDDAMKGTVAERAAFYINLIDHDLGLLKKPGTAHGHDNDKMVQRGTGYYVDMLTTSCCVNGQRFAVARWAVGSPDANTSDQTRWMQPTAELAGLTDVPPVVVTPPVVVPPVTPPVSGGTLAGIQAQLAGIAADLAEHATKEEAHWANVKGVWEGTFKPILTFIGKYVAPIVGGWLLGSQVSQ